MSILVRFRTMGFCVWLLGCIVSPALAHSIWLDRSHARTLSFELLKPNFDGDAGTTFGTSSMFVTGRFETSRVTVVGEIPLSHFGQDGGDSETAFGNPYIGVEVHAKNSAVSQAPPAAWHLFGDLGIRLPVADVENNFNAILVGLLTDFVDRSEAFTPDAVPFSAAMNFSYKIPDGIVIRIRAGQVSWIPIDNREDSELFLIYSLQTGYESGRASFVFGYSGRLSVTGDNLDFSERTLSQIGFAASHDVGPFRPSLSFRAPLDQDLSDVINFAFGLGLSYRFD